MKHILTIGLFVLLFIYLPTSAQAPQGINYQGVARSLDGQPLAQKDISIRISILNQSSSGEVEYDEIHEVKTNSFGLFTLVIGQGTSGTSNFSFIGWTTGPKWLQIELDENGGRNFKLMGSQQLMSVPYALYAERSGNGYQAGQGISINNNMISNAGDGDNDSTNELISTVTLGADNKLRISDAGGIKEADLSGLLGASQNLSNVLSEGNSAGNSTITNLAAPVSAADAATKAYVDAHLDGDANSSNELQDLSSSSSGTDRTINISGGTGITIDVADNDNNVTNEIQKLSDVLSEGSDANGSVIENLGTPLLGSDAATKAYVDNHNDGDASPTNEIQDLSLSSNILKITNNTSATDINLAAYLDDTDKQDLSSTVSGTDRTINISGGLGTTISVADNDNNATNEAQSISRFGDIVTLSSVGATGGGSFNMNDAAGNKITNVADPITSQDAATKKYVDDADAMISTTYAFSANFNYTNPGVAEINVPINFSSEDFDDQGVLDNVKFKAQISGTYMFYITGIISGGTISAEFLGTSTIPLTSKKGQGIDYLEGTLLLKLNANDEVRLRISVANTGTVITNGKFFGFKL